MIFYFDSETKITRLYKNKMAELLEPVSYLLCPGSNVF